VQRSTGTEVSSEKKSPQEFGISSHTQQKPRELMIPLVMVAQTANPMEGEQQLDLYWYKPDNTGCEHI